MPLPPPLPATEMVRSAAILPSGEVLRLIDARALIATLPPALRVLVAEDSATQRERARRALSAAGYVVEVAEDGRAALTALLEGDFDALLTDFEMPQMDGIELVTELGERGLLDELSVIVWSASDNPTLPSAAAEAGADGFVEKGPEAEAAVLDAFRRLLSDS
jgi:CheY-like chemotaxis protein